MTETSNTNGQPEPSGPDFWLGAALVVTVGISILLVKQLRYHFAGRPKGGYEQGFVDGLNRRATAAGHPQRVG